MRNFVMLVWLWLLPSVLMAADGLDLPQDPRQSISYWKAHTISRDQDARVALAEGVFNKLLRAWDNSRVEPGLYVVNASNSAWAASLADGNILLSRSAIDISMAAGRQRGEHLLAFVLAHELAHQRSDDLWHQRFFRSLRQQDQHQQARLLDGLPLDADLILDIEQKEAQADRDGLVMMASVGFDPWQVLGQQDFFTNWVESIWKLTCSQPASKAFHEACRQAQTRALRARVQLNAVAGQAAIYELGIQALVAGSYPLARHYFTLYGREYPGRAIMSAIGTSYLAEAMELRRRSAEIDPKAFPDYYYPLLLDARPGVGFEEPGSKRGVAGIELDALQLKLREKTALAIQFLERAIRLDPDYRPPYLSLAIAHLLENNQYLVRGVLQGRYIPRFGEDAAALLLLALNRSLEGEHAAAQRELNALIAKPQAFAEQSVMSAELLQYTAVFNLARLQSLLDREHAIQPLWKSLALRAQAAGQTFLFRLALQQLGAVDGVVGGELEIAPTVKGVRLGDRKPRDDSAHQVNELWIEGELYHVYVYQDGARYISAADGRIISASQVGGQRLLGNLLSVGAAADRPLKTLGIPDRRLQLTTGEYIAYDRYGLALKLDDNRIQGWFLYP